MTRNRIVATFLFVLELCCIIGIGKFLYHDVQFKVTKTSAKDINIYDEDSNGKFKVTFYTQCPCCDEYHVFQKVFLTKEELDEFKRTNIIKLNWGDLHFVIWLILYWIIGIIFVAFALLTSIQCFDNCYQTMSYRKCDDCPAKLKCKICLKADNINLDPIKKNWYNFFGYETSSADTNSSNNC